MIVRLPSAGKSFTAIAGVDSNEQTISGKGSVVFSVKVGGDLGKDGSSAKGVQTVFQSQTMREGMPGVSAQADLGGASEFALEVGDAGDGISCDQADWADARVLLSDGTTVWLGDLPIINATHRAYGRRPLLVPLRRQAVGRVAGEVAIETGVPPLDAQRIEHAITYTDPKTGLVIRCVGVEYGDFPTVEWTLRFKNTSDKETPILSDIQALDTQFERLADPNVAESEFCLHHQAGSPCQPNDYEPLETVLGPGVVKQITTAGGRPTNSDLPYFNVDRAPRE